MPNPKQSYKERVLKEFENTILVNGASHCFECCDYELICSDTKDFISKALDNQIKEVLACVPDTEYTMMKEAYRLEFMANLKKAGLI